MKYSVKDVKRAIPIEKKKRDSIWTKIWPRPLSYYFSAFLLNIYVTPNMVSVISIIVAILASVFIGINSEGFIIAGLILLNLFIEFDCIDGMMARTLKSNSYMGEFYDAMGGYTMCAFPLLSIGLCAYHTGRNIILNDGEILLILAALGCICDIFSRLIYQKYTSNVMIADSKNGRELIRENDRFYSEKPSFSITYLRLLIDREFGVAGFFPPIVLLAYIFKFIDCVVIIYSIYHILAFLIALILFCRKASLYDYLVMKEDR